MTSGSDRLLSSVVAALLIGLCDLEPLAPYRGACIGGALIAGLYAVECAVAAGFARGREELERRNLERRREPRVR